MTIFPIFLFLLSLFLAPVSARFGSSSVDYTLIIGYPSPAEGAPACTLEETARLDRHAREALIAAGESARGNSDGVLSYNGGQKQDPAALANALEIADGVDGSAVAVVEMAESSCDPDCAYWCKILNVCTCCTHACCQGGSDHTTNETGLRLRDVTQDELPSKLTQIRSKYMFLTAADMGITCVDAMDAVVTVSAGYLPSASFTSSWE